MKRAIVLLAALLSPLSPAHAQALRPPAVPLVTHDPYFSVWSTADTLTEDQTRHWTGTVQSLYSAVRVDGKVFRVMGREVRGPQTPALEQKTLTVSPTRTVYTFSGAGIGVTLTFLTPAFPDDLDVLSRPTTYLTWEVTSSDGQPHDVRLYFDASADLAVNTPEQPVTWSRFRLGPHTALRAGSASQPVLEKFGDNLRIDWGYFYAISPSDDVATYAGDRDAVRASFRGRRSAARSGRLLLTARRRAARRFTRLCVGPQTRGRPARLPLRGSRIRRWLFDRVPEPQAAPVVAEKRRRSRRSSRRRHQGLRPSQSARSRVRRCAHDGSAEGWRRTVRQAGRAGVSTDARGAQACCRPGWHAAAVFEGELQQRLHRDGGRHVPEQPVLPVVQSDAAPRDARRR